MYIVIVGGITLFLVPLGGGLILSGLRRLLGSADEVAITDSNEPWWYAVLAGIICLVPVIAFYGWFFFG